MQGFSFAFNVECLHSNWLAKLQMYSFERAKHAKTCKCRIQKILQVQLGGKISAHDAHIYQQYIDIAYV